jgi:signal transduction histidine kinase
MALGLNRQRLELLYSAALILLIPACIIAGTLWLTNSVKDNFDQELRRKANLANEVFGVSAAQLLNAAGDPSRAGASIQSLIDQTRPQAPEIDFLEVAAQQGNGFTTIASSNQARVGQTDDSIQTQLAWSKTQSIASLIAQGEEEQREWLVATPILSPSGQPIAVTTMRVSLHSADQLMSDTLRRATIALAVMLTIIMALLLHHFRVVEYAELFRKQKELDQMKDDFISVATHELKAPMSLIKGYISMALEFKLAKEPSQMMHIAYDQTERLNHLVNDLLDVSRLEQGRTKYNLQPVDLPVIIQPMLTLYTDKAKAKGLQLQYSAPKDLPAVTADPDRTSEIFTNLIDNAVKYSRAGSVRIEHIVAEGRLITNVSDTGIGMTPDEQSRLFQRFYRARNDDTKEIAGTGLGLWIIKQYIEHMGGTIAVTSEKGKGTTFSVVLPTVTDRYPAD